MTVALPPRAFFTCVTSVSGLLAGALTSTAMLRTRPSWRPRAWSTIPSTPEIPTGAWAPTVSVVLVPALTGYWPPLTSPAVRSAAAVVIRSPAAKSDHTGASPAVAGGVHGRSADSAGGEHGELRAVDGDLRPVDGQHRPDAAQLAQPGQVRLGHPARHRGDDVGHDQPGVVAPVRVARDDGSPAGAGRAAGGWRWRAGGRAARSPRRAALRPTAAGPPESAATRAATAAQTATSPPPTTAGRARRLSVSSLTVTQLYKAPPRPGSRPDHRRASCCYPCRRPRRGGPRRARMVRIYRVIAGTVVATTTL